MGFGVAGPVDGELRCSNRVWISVLMDAGRHCGGGVASVDRECRGRVPFCDVAVDDNEWDLDGCRLGLISVGYQYIDEQSK